MNTLTHELADKARKLKPEERFALVEEILNSLDHPDPAIERQWQEEAARRLAAYRSGRVVGVPAEDVLGPL
ncbi:addiction module protein [Thauera sp. WH-1]|uniref:addiction module protein n=1 Tax=Thauera sp. WH-1 TaxID=3398230 RepID=UPI0039FC506A